MEQLGFLPLQPSVAFLPTPWTLTEIEMTDVTIEIEPHLTRLTRYARSLVRNPALADDLVQDTVMRALEKAHLYQSDTNLRGWLVTIMHNEHVNGVRRAMRGAVLVSDEQIAGLGHPSTQEAPVELREIRGAVQRLPKKQREPLILHWLHGLKYDEIARRMDLPIGTVQSRISRARKALRTMIDAPDSRLGLAHQPRQPGREHVMSAQ
jgi:RNA polymerase sigma-70 factor (ECF subfamily)